ncbi:hypothetical protein [Micromonospora sp. WMMD710]|uniref:hypothetical protein n=1 Tax=Micromonospora sp. WMMD710 TaxID=3016085 RepID=UPI002417F56E|nr:hypothetical protein [Micromonospora sp. WMMD710]MDG4756604.1 hypothetical protein [Micromonospora sp. WMMD710]
MSIGAVTWPLLRRAGYPRAVGVSATRAVVFATLLAVALSFLDPHGGPDVPAHPGPAGDRTRTPAYAACSR